MAIARWSLTALDCPDPVPLAEFYAALTGWTIREQPDGDPDWLQLVSPGGATIAFQRVDDYRPPAWPGQDHPQQAHLDFDVPDLDTGEAAVISLGAHRADFQPSPEGFRIYLDPAGHPFCLVLRRGITV